MINSHTQVTTRIDEELTDLSLHRDSLDQGTRAGFTCVDQDLETLDQRIDCRRAKCEKTEEELRVTEGRIEVLTVRVDTQREMIQDLIARVEEMEGRLCHCGKGKARERLQEVPSVETGAKCPIRRTGQRVIRRVWIAFTTDLMPA